jgi:hypothetical protein
MSAESDRFRKRATECRTLAKDARDQESRHTLSDMAVDLDAEAAEIDAEEAAEEAREAEPSSGYFSLPTGRATASVGNVCGPLIADVGLGVERCPKRA